MNNATATAPGLLTLAVNKLFESPLVLFFGGCALSILHHLYSFYLLLVEYVSKLHSALRFVEKLRTDNLEFSDSLREKLLNLKQIPNHLVLILGPEAPSYRDIAKLITWCIPAGISHVSIYDHKNTLDRWQLFETFSCTSKQNLHKIKWGKSFDEEIKIFSKKRINGFSWTPAVTVHCLELNDGLRQTIENVKALHADNIHEVTLPELSQMMSRSLGVPDPQLAIICGSSFTFYGCCPWNMRVTQMIMLKSHVNLTATRFVSILHQYSFSEQRYGK
uniref:ditrans,polycis-polyprenyl diphosphate synthase [(2E,6E)-farnesyldiphosphate specific] n=2 Tax=Lygus hesperus TaxID=30085 RepID=A0A146M048_LYGHE